MSEVTSSEPTFGACWAMADAIPGWLTRAQARLLWDAVLRLRPGSEVVEIGSHQGRSTVVLAAAAGCVSARVTAIDPFVEGRLFGGPGTRELFLANVRATGVGERVRLIVDHSTRVRPTWREPIDLLYIDGKHDYWTVRDDLRWARHLPPGAEVLIHDAFSSVGVTLGLLAHVLPGWRLAYVDRAGSLARFAVGRPNVRDRLRFVGQLPWFTRNVVVKLLLRLRLFPLVRLLGHRGRVDPY
jgi:precorrin-6B methylase 2